MVRPNQLYKIERGQNYFEAEKTGGKTFRRVDGSLDKWGYTHRQKYTPFRQILAAFKYLLHCETFLDVGAGCGSSLEYTRQNRIVGYGFDFSRWATRNRLEGAAGRIFCADARYAPIKDGEFDLVFSSDLLEHIFLPYVDMVIGECYRVSRKWVFHQISTPTENESGFVLKEGEPIPLELEHYAVAGHVLVQPFEWWEQRLRREGWVSRSDLVRKFRRLVDENAIKFWRTIFLMEKTGG